MGLSRPDDAVVVGEGLGTVFLARREDDGRPVEGYDWGALTSSSALQPLWLLLLPFTSIRYTERLAEAGIAPSVGSVGDS